MTEFNSAEKDGIKLAIYYDEIDCNPRENDGNMTRMVCFHTRYNLGDKHEYKSSNFSSWSEIEAQLKKDYDIVEICPLYLYDHSGITISMSHGYPYNDQWDAGMVGFVFVDKEKIRENYAVKRVTKKQIDRALKEMESEVELYDDYLRGEVFGFSITKANTCGCCGHTEPEHIESTGGFIGTDFKKNGLFETVKDVTPDQYATIVNELVEALS